MNRGKSSFNATAEETTDYTRLASPTQMTRAHLTHCRGPDALVKRGTQVFAVAFSRGMIYNTAKQTETEGTAVLYMDATGERVTERWFPADTDPVRACLVDGTRLDDAGECARHFTGALACHPEVTTVESNEDPNAGKELVCDGGYDHGHEGPIVDKTRTVGTHDTIDIVECEECGYTAANRELLDRADCATHAELDDGPGYSRRIVTDGGMRRTDGRLADHIAALYDADTGTDVTIETARGTFTGDLEDPYAWDGDNGITHYEVGVALDDNDMGVGSARLRALGDDYRAYRPSVTLYEHGGRCEAEPTLKSIEWPGMTEEPTVVTDGGTKVRQDFDNRAVVSIDGVEQVVNRDEAHRLAKVSGGEVVEE